ncbi:MAG: hypothetical protein ACKKL5_01890 [Candidatus Komeilibacteria bacterium]
MRSTKFVFFTILLLLTAVLIFIIVGESDNFASDKMIDKSPQSNIADNTEPIVMSVIHYQSTVRDILLRWQEALQTDVVTPPVAMEQLREQLLALDNIPIDLKDLHFMLVVSFSRALQGEIGQAQSVWEELSNTYTWLADSLSFFINLSK